MRLRACLLLVLGSATAGAAPSWTAGAPPPPFPSQGRAVFDSARGRIVLFGGDLNGTPSTETWEFDSTSWRLRPPAPAALTPRRGHAMAYDGGRQRVVLYGGAPGTTTWEFDGRTWLAGAPAPAALDGRIRHDMAFDASRGLVALFGGYGTSIRNDTWLYDGAAWTPGPAAPPALVPRAGHAMAYDAGRSRIVLAGGRGSSVPFLSDTWHLTATGWTAGGTLIPYGLTDLGLAYDAGRDRIVAFGGMYWAQASGVPVPLNQTIEYDGATWTRGAEAPPGLEAQDGAGHLVWDAARGGLVLLGKVGQPYWYLPPALWEHDGAGWKLAHLAPSLLARSGHGMAFDDRRGVVVLHGGSLAEHLWEYDGISWRRGPRPPGDPLLFAGSSMAFDTARGRMVLFGGPSKETWEYDGSSFWRGPPRPHGLWEREGPAVAYDPRRAVIVIAAGYGMDYNGHYWWTDTWEYDGRNFMPGGSLPPSFAGRTSASMSYEPQSGRLLMVGGLLDTSSMTDEALWYDGAWSPAPSGPPPRSSAAQAVDPLRARTTVQGGSGLPDTWELAGGVWVPGPTAPFSARAGSGMAPLPALGGLVLMGGYDTQMRDDTWHYQCQSLAPPALPDAALGFPYRATLTASGGGGGSTFAVTAGALPAGLWLDPSGILSGIPPVPGASDFVVRAVDGSGCGGGAAYRIVVGGCALSLSSELPAAVVGARYGRRLTAEEGTPPYTFTTIAGALAPGLSLQATGEILGTPVAPAATRFVVRAVDATGCVADRAYLLTAEALDVTFDSTAEMGPPPHSVWFDAVSRGATPTSWRWDFGDGATSAGYPAAAHTYGASGFYTVTLTTGVEGVTDVERRVHAVRVTDVPTQRVLAGSGPGRGSTARIVVHTADGTVRTYFVPDGNPSFGSNVGAGKITTDATDKILSGPGPGPNYGPRVRAFHETGASIPKVSFWAYGTLAYGVHVGAGDVDGDGFDEILTAPGPGAVFGPHIRAFDFDGNAVVPISRVSFFAFSTLKYGARVAGGSIDGDPYDELVAAPGPGPTFAATLRGFNYDGTMLGAIAKVNFIAFPEPYGARVALGDVDGDVPAEIVAGTGAGPANAGRLRGFNFDGGSLQPITGIEATVYTTRFGLEPSIGELSGWPPSEIHAGPGGDPAAASRHAAFRVVGAALEPLGYAGFEAMFGPWAFGIKVASATLP